MTTTRKQELLDFAGFLEQKEAVRRPRRSLKGALADLHINITEADIRKAGNEMRRGYTQDTDDQK